MHRGEGGSLRGPTAAGTYAVDTHLSEHLELVLAKRLQFGWGGSAVKELLGSHQEEEVVEQESHEILGSSDLQQTNKQTPTQTNK